METQKNTAVFVRLKDNVTYQCHQWGQCCRHIEHGVMVESIDAYQITKYLKEGQNAKVTTIDDVLSLYCDLMPLTEKCFPIFMMKTTGPDAACVFLKNGRCSIYEARPRTCRIYPFSMGPGERGRDFTYCLCFDNNRQYHFSGKTVSVKDWFYRNVPREEKEYLKLEYAAVEKMGKLMHSIPAEICEQMLFQNLYYRYYNFDLEQPFLPQYQRNICQLLEKLREVQQRG